LSNSLEKFAMKKTLIALAALASVSAFAQSSVTISGGVAYGYQSTTTTADAVAAGTANTTGIGAPGAAAVAALANAKASGFGMDTAAIKLTAVEDLGGGLKATGVISAGGLARGNAVTGEDMSLTLAGGFGSIMMGQIEIGSGIRGLAQAGAPVNNMEGEVLAAASAGTDIVKYTAPAMNGFTFSASQTEAKGIATGLDTATKGTSAVTAGVDYAAGPLSAKLDYSDYNSLAAAGTINNRYRIAASYDLGVAKVGAGIEDQKLVAGGTGTKNKLTMVGVSAPFGAVTLGAAWVKADNNGTAGSKSGSTVGVSYALSKRTSLVANYASWDYKEGSSIKNKKTTVLLAHSF
jgi:predicted porin